MHPPPHTTTTTNRKARGNINHGRHTSSTTKRNERIKNCCRICRTPSCACTYSTPFGILHLPGMTIHTHRAGRDEAPFRRRLGLTLRVGGCRAWSRTWRCDPLLPQEVRAGARGVTRRDEGGAYLGGSHPGCCRHSQKQVGCGRPAETFAPLPTPDRAKCMPTASSSPSGCRQFISILSFLSILPIISSVQYQFHQFYQLYQFHQLYQILIHHQLYQVSIISIILRVSIQKLRNMYLVRGCELTLPHTRRQLLLCLQHLRLWRWNSALIVDKRSLQNSP